jgi:hypothetical protein
MADGTHFANVLEVIEHLKDYERNCSIPVGYEVRNMLRCLAEEVLLLKERSHGDGDSSK